MAPDHDLLNSSAYAESLRSEIGTRSDPGRYPGSIALGAQLLPAESDVVAFELVAASATELSERLAAMGRPATVEVAAGLTGVCELVLFVDLVLLDPFHVHERGNAFSSAEAFSVLATRGVSTILWYAIYDPSESDEWIVQRLRGTRLVVQSLCGLGLVGRGPL